MRKLIVALYPMVLVACGRANAPPAVDTAAARLRAEDSIIALRTQQAPALADSARQTLATLLKRPETATFDSVIVVQPPKQDGNWPSPWVCGRIGGKPGIGGTTKPTPFIYQNRINVFVLDNNNASSFAALRAKGCANAAARVLLR